MLSSIHYIKCFEAINYCHNKAFLRRYNFTNRMFGEQIFLNLQGIGMIHYNGNHKIHTCFFFFLKHSKKEVQVHKYLCCRPYFHHTILHGLYQWCYHFTSKKDEFPLQTTTKIFK